MKTIYLLFFINIIIANMHHLLAQNKIAVVNTQELLETIKEKVYLDSMYLAIHDSLMQVSHQEVKKLQKKYIEYHKYYRGCSPVSKDNEKVKEIQTDQKKLEAFEKYILDTLTLFKQEALKEITQLIDEEVTVYSKEKGLIFVVDTKELKYYNGTIDVTSEICPRVKARQANNPIWIDKVEALKAKFFIEDRLKYKL